MVTAPHPKELSVKLSIHVKANREGEPGSLCTYLALFQKINSDEYVSKFKQAFLVLVCSSEMIIYYYEKICLSIIMSSAQSWLGYRNMQMLILFI